MTLAEQIIEDAKKRGGTHYKVSCKKYGAVKEGVQLFICRLLIDGVLTEFGVGTAEIGAQMDLHRKMKER